MNYRNHLAFGCAASIATPIIMNKLGIHLNRIDYAVIIGSCIAGGVFPDTDTASIPSRIYATLGAVMSIMFFMMGMNNLIAVLWIPFILAKMSKHRGWTHNRALPVAVTAIPFLIFMLTVDVERFRHIARYMFDYRFVFISFSIGMVVHLILDTKWFRKFAIAIGIHKD